MMFYKLLTGLISSIALLIISAYLIYIPCRSRTAYNSGLAFDSAGILQLTWLLGTEPRLAHVRTTDISVLRRAGMFNVQMSEKAARREYIDSESVENNETLQEQDTLKQP